MKKAMTYVGIIVVTLLMFFVTATALDAAMNELYYNTSLIDWLYDADCYSVVMWSICLIPAFEIYSALKTKCGLR